MSCHDYDRPLHHVRFIIFPSPTKHRWAPSSTCPLLRSPGVPVSMAWWLLSLDSLTPHCLGPEYEHHNHSPAPASPVLTARLLEASHDIWPPLYPASRTICPHRHCCLREPPPSEFLHHQEEEPPSGLAFGRRDAPGLKWVASLQVSGPTLVQGGGGRCRVGVGACGGCRKGTSYPIPDFLSSPLFFPLVPGGANEAEGLSGAAHQLHPQERADGQVPWLGGSLSGQSPAHPGPGAGCLEDLQPPLLRVSGVLPSVHVSGDVTLVPLQSKDWGGVLGVWDEGSPYRLMGSHHTE